MEDEDLRTKVKKGRLKAGLLLSVDALNRVIPQISDRQPLEEIVLNALRSREFAQQFGYAARTHIELQHGIVGESAALWVYPELAMRSILLKRATTVASDGMVEAFSDESVFFPVPAAIHIVGVMTQR